MAWLGPFESESGHLTEIEAGFEWINVDDEAEMGEPERKKGCCQYDAVC